MDTKACSLTSSEIRQARRFAQTIIIRKYTLAGDTETLARILLDALDELEGMRFDLGIKEQTNG